MHYQRLRSVGAVLLVALFLPLACGEKAAPTPLPGCERAPRPIVFAHGMMGGGDNFASTMMRFASKGYCREYLRAIDWNTLAFDLESHAEALADYDRFYRLLPEVHRLTADTAAEIRQQLREKYLFSGEWARSSVLE